MEYVCWAVSTISWIGTELWAACRNGYLALWAAAGSSKGGLGEGKQRERHVYVSAVTGSLGGNRLSVMNDRRTHRVHDKDQLLAPRH